MPAPGEHKTVQSCILKYAQEMSWTFVPREGSGKKTWFYPLLQPADAGEGDKSVMVE